ncbi:sugar O-acetyltransferase [Bremerella cremea]|uniref:sugar O-acetyltransferase n=1 Tax=Bremerella cremea TaxID=1031537 RepID=UPI0031EFB6DF
MTSQRELMLAGELYDASDADLVAAREKAHDLCFALNATRDAEKEARTELIAQLLGASPEGLTIQPPFQCDYGVNIQLGRNCYFNFNCVVLDVCQVTIGDHCLFGPGVQIYTATHPLDVVTRRRLENGKPIVIGDDVWIGGSAIICPGVTIGSGSVIGAGSVVTRDIPANVFAAGNPCRVIRPLES